MDDLVGGVEESAGGIDLDEDGLVVIGRRGVESPGNVFGGDGMDGVVNDDFQDVCVGRNGEQRRDERNKQRDEPRTAS